MEKNNEVEVYVSNKTDWGFVINLLCTGAILWMICFMGIQFDRQSKRIDRLELEVITLLPPKQLKAEVDWHDKEKPTAGISLEDKEDTQTKKHFSEDWEYSTKIRYISAVGSRLSGYSKDLISEHEGVKRETVKLLKDVLAITVLNIKNDRIVEKAIPTIVKANSLLAK